ncbi:MAG: EamA family transporter [Rhodomicrobium sp.]|nr:EamA family transporter [Rhodomicrobium sp.]
MKPAKRQLATDALAGLTVAIVALPLSMAIAIASGVGPERGLYTAIVGGFFVSALGGSRFQIGGPAGAFIVLVAATVARHGIDGLLLAVFLFVIMDATGKALTADYNVWQISWARYLFHLGILPLLLAGQRPASVLRTSRLKLQLLRSACLLGATFFFFSAVTYIPLAEATAIGFVSPLLVAAFSVPLLGEKVGPRRWAAVIVGFLAVMLIIRPGFGMIHWAYLLPLGSASLFCAVSDHDPDSEPV